MFGTLDHVSRRPENSLYTQSLYPRARRPPSPHPAPNNAGVVLVVIMLLAIVAAVAVVGPDVVKELRQMVYCLDHAQEATC